MTAERHIFIDSRGRNLCDRCNQWEGNPAHVEPYPVRRQDRGPRSEDYQRGYDAGYHAGWNAGVRAAGTIGVER